MGVGNKVQPGDFVDVFVMLKSDGKDIDRSQARLLLSRKRVLAFGNASVDGLPSKMADKAAPRAASPAQRAGPHRRARGAVDDINRLTLADAAAACCWRCAIPTDMSEPDPKLFAELPTALQPAPSKAGEPRRAPLEGLDRAQAGLTAADLVTGGKGPAVRIPARSRPSSRAPATALQRPSRLQVEVIRGERSETMNY
jgi:pilus assembly protein CpaB